MCCPLCRYQECGSKAKRKQDTDRKDDKVLDLEVGVKRVKRKCLANLRNHCTLSGAELRQLFRKKESVVTCHLCSKSFISGKQLEVHVAKCAEVVCSKCKVKFSSVGLLASHRADCAVFACQTCPKRFVSQDTLAAHQLSKHATAKCHFCLACFTSDVECYAHKSDYHNFECDVCLKVFLYTIDQMKNKFTKTKAKVICDLCERNTVLEESDGNDQVELEEELEELPVSNSNDIKVEIENQVYPIKLEATQLSGDPLENEGDNMSQEDAFYAILPENRFGDGEETTMQYQCCYCRGVYNSFNELNNHLIDSHNLQLQELSTDSQLEKDNTWTDALEKYQIKIDQLFDTSLTVIDFESQTKYSCTVCEKKFKSSASYRKHTFRSHKVHLLFGLDKQFHCQHCRVDRNSLSDLNKHLYSRHESHFKCEYCDTVVPTKRQKKMHILSHHPDQPAFSCLDCALKFTSHNELKQHCSWHWFHEIIECSDCNKKIKGKKKFKDHMNYHKLRQKEGEQEIICPECGKGLSSRSSLQAHLRYVHRGGNDETILCGDCGLLVKVRRFNRHHERMHSQGNLFRCHICSRSFFAKELLRQHMDTHIDGRPHECDQCPAAFKQVRNLRMHKRNYHSDITTSCKMCNVNFDTPEAYSVHRLTYHKRTPRPIKLDTEDGFQCPLCPKTLKSSRAVATHRRIAHEKHLHVKCDLCNLEFPFIRQLQSHMTSHTEPKPDLSCGFCHRTFTTLGSLNSHIKWVHVGERNFPCTYCPAKFKRKDAQIVHERTHTDERPYSCGVCQRRFRQRTDCKRHEAKHSMPGFRYNKPHRMRPRPLPEVVIEEVVEQEGGLLLQVPGEDNQAAAFLSYIVQN